MEGSSLSQYLLKTKLYVPSVRPDPATGRGARLVARPQLVAQLDAGLRPGCKLVLISAPAGFGKTTLAAAWLLACGCSVAWVSLDGGDNDPVRFLRYLIAALQTIDPQVGQAAQRLLQSPQLPPLESLLTVLVNELCALPGQAILVLDEYHLITTAEVHQAVGFLLDRLPPQVRLAILTRADPPLPLSRLRARGQLVELRAAQLRFQRDEAGAFLNQAMGLELSAGDVAAMQASTEGWIAGLQLAAIALQSQMAARGREGVHGFVSAFTGSHHYIVDYLVEEVLDRQPEAMRSFLLQTSILERLSGPLCNALTGREDGQATLRALEHANLFVVPLDDERRWYRYHHLFAEVLRSCLHELHPDWLPELHRRAAGWYEQNGLVAEALSHALAVGDQERAVRLVESSARAMFMHGELVTLENWLKALGGAVSQRPWLGIHRAWTLILSGQRDELGRLLDEVEEGITAGLPQGPAEGQELLGEVYTLRGLLAYYEGDIPRAMQFCRQALEGLREENEVVRGIAVHVLAVASSHDGNLAGAIQANAEAVRLGKATGSVLLAVSALTFQGDMWIEHGRLRRAAEAFREALQWTTLPDGSPLLVDGRADVGLGKVLYEWDELEAAAGHLQRGIALCQQGGTVEHQAVGYAVLTRTRQALGDPDGAREAAREGERLALEHTLPVDTVSSLQGCRVRLWLAQGDLERAARWAQQIDPQVHGPASTMREAERVVLVRVLLAQGEADAALALSDRMLRAAEAAGRMGRAIVFLVFQALAWQAKEDLPRALAALERALALAQPEGYVRTFVDEGAPVASLLRRAGSRGDAPHQAYVAQLLAKMAAASGAPLPPAQPLVESFSERELEVLRLLAAGKSNREIADELVLAVGTVKRHLNNIFGKLDVQSRLQCVARAREVGLVD